MSVAVAKARLAVEVKRGKKSGSNHSAIEAARRVLVEEKIREFVEKTVASAPPLAEEQKARLIACMRGCTS